MAQNITTTRPVGEYFENSPGGDASLGDYFSTTRGGQMTGLGSRNITQVGRSPDGLGSVFDMSPLLRDVRKVRRSIRGLGQDENQGQGTEGLVAQEPTNTAALVTALLFGAFVRGTAGYLVGKAVAPDENRETKYALWGIPAAIFLGTLGLGIEGAVALSKR